MADLSDFDRYCDEHGVDGEDAPEAFAQWLADHTKAPVIGGPVGEPPTVVAIPDEVEDDE